MPGREKGHGEAKRDRLALRVNPHISRKGQQKGGVPDPLDFHGIPSGNNIKANKMHSSCYGFLRHTQMTSLVITIGKRVP